MRVKWDCEFERRGGSRKNRQTRISATISEVTNTFINTGLKQALGEVDRNLVESLRVAVL